MPFWLQKTIKVLLIFNKISLRVFTNHTVMWYHYNMDENVHLAVIAYYCVLRQEFQQSLYNRVKDFRDLNYKN